LLAGTAWGVDGPLTPDTTLPTISNVVVSNVTATGATISFTTDEATTGWVSYTGPGCPCADVFSAGVGTTHTVALSGLTPGTVYQYAVHARDLAGNEQTTAQATLQTPQVSTDPEPPVVSLVQPGPGPVAGTVTVEATATDNVGVTSVAVYVDDVLIGTVNAAPYDVAWDTATVADGAHTLRVDARDAANNVGTTSAVVLVQNAPVSTAPHYLDLDGVDDYVQIADAPGLSFGNGTADTPLTIEMWLRPDAATAQQLIGKWGEGINQEYRIFIGGGSLRVDLRDQSTRGLASVFLAALPASALVGNWHHLAVTYDGRGGATAADGLTIYVDGVAQAVWRINDPTYVAMENGAAPVELGREGPFWLQYGGGLDEVRLWNVARTASELQAMMALELTGAEPGLVGYWRFNEGAGTTSADGSPGQHPALLLAGTAWGVDGPLTPDTTLPTISNVVVSNVTATGATISFSTDEATTGWVSYTGPGCPCADVFSAGTGTTHVVTLSGLTPDTVYEFVVHARDLATNEQATAPAPVQMLILSTDFEAPVVSVVQPGSGPVAGTVAIEATATDNVGVVSVAAYVDDVLIGTDTTAPYSIAWDTTTVADGAHTLRVEARDAANNVGTVSPVVLVQNTPVSTAPHYLVFDGVDDSVRVADAAGLSFGNGTTDTPLTIEMWLRPDAATGQLIGKWGEGINQEYRIFMGGGSLRVDLRDQSAGALATVFTSSLSLASLVGTWHHVAVTYDGRGGATAADGLTIYVDGVEQPVWRINDPTYVAMENGAAPVEIGREGPFWLQYGGGLDEVRLWNVLRTVSEIQGAMGLELTGTELGLVGYWRFNEGAGTTSADGSPGQHPALLQAGTAWVADGPLTPDTTVPTIANVAVTNLTPTGATISFTTDEATTGWVSYTTTSCPCPDVFSAGVGTTHVVTLSGLTPGTTWEAAGNRRSAESAGAA
jgi:chitodextrinase